MKKNSYISAMDKTALNDSQKDKLKDLYNAVNNPTEDKIMSIKENKKTRRKPLAVVAASLALIIGIGAFSFAMPKSNNSFMLTVNAAELTEGKSVLADTSAFGFAVSEGDDNLDHYSIDFPVKYEGDNIKSVTYSINKGRFELYRFDDSNESDEKKIADYQESDTKAENEENIYYSIPYESDAISSSEDAKVDSSYYKTKKFTVGYDDQKNSQQYIYITGDSKHLTKQESDEVKKAFYGKFLLERKKAAFDKLLGDLIITSTINFNDGTTETQNIKIGTKIVDYKEATTDEIPLEKQGSILAFTFELV